MCGLVGIAGKLEYKDEAVIKHLLYLDMWRGKDSTGMAGIRNSGEVKLAKIASHPLDLFDTVRFKDALNGSQSRAFIGHNRAATKGLVNNVNAHPFVLGHIVGAHNGTLFLNSHKALEEEMGEKFDVDSQAIFACIEKIGLKATVAMLQGAWALVYYDLNEGTLNFVRNKERPLWYAYNEELNKVFWSSEYEFISYATKVGPNPTTLFTDEKKYTYWPIEENQHYCFDIEALRNATPDSPYKPKMKEMRGKEATGAANGRTDNPFGMSSGNGGGSTSTSNSTSNTSSTQGTGTSTTTSRFKQRKQEGKDRTDQRTVSLLGTKVNPFAGMVNRKRFDELAKNGCSWCTTPIAWGDTGLTIIERLDIIHCSNCTNHDSASNRVVVPDIKMYL